MKARSLNTRNRVILAILLGLASLAMYVSIFVKVGSE